MERFKLTLSSEQDPSYTIFFGHEEIAQFAQHIDISNYSRVAVISDTNVSPHWSAALTRALPIPHDTFVLPAGETNKTLSTLSTIWTSFQEMGLDRRSLVLNLGGGVIGDMGGFAASTYMRGIDFIQLPTTLLSQVDASVGGKVGINFSGVKNLLGTFQQPKAVFIDVATLRTLPLREFRSGFAEIVKHGLIQDEAYFQQLGHTPPTPEDTETLLSWIKRSCEIKADVVQRDVREGGLRKILNFGHTIGHAIESHALHTTTPLLHGEAIALGMIAEAEISRSLGYIPASLVEHIEHTLQTLGLPTRLSSPYPRAVLEDMMLADKKNHRGTIRWTLLKRCGEAIFDQEVEDHHIDTALQRIQPSS